MGHAKVENKTPFAFEALYLVDEELRPLVVPIVKATFAIGRDGRCVRAEEQLPLNTGGECWGDDPETSSYKYEPEVAFMKPATDVVLVGHAYAARRDTKEMRVGLRVGPLNKDLLAFGDRVWFKALGSISMTKPIPFEKIPLTYERAFGGWDRAHADPRKHACEPRNPIGTGFRGAGGFVEGIRVANIEDPRTPIKGFGDRPAPAGVGFVSPHWQPRAALAGTYDEAWKKDRSPLLPKNFDRRHLNGASPGLIAPGYLRGDEAVTAVGVSPEGTLSFSLPALPAPNVRIVRQGGQAQPVPLALDTIIIEPDDRRVILLWRGNLALRTGPHDVESIEVSVAQGAAQRANVR
jgi:hypothetical protein